MDKEIITAQNVTLPIINAVDITRLNNLWISITKLSGEIVSGSKAIGQILEERESNSTGGAANNADGKNAYAKVGFSTYNVTNACKYGYE